MYSLDMRTQRSRPPCFTFIPLNLRKQQKRQHIDCSTTNLICPQYYQLYFGKNAVATSTKLEVPMSATMSHYSSQV